MTFTEMREKKSVVMDHVSTLMNCFSTVHNFPKCVHYSKPLIRSIG